MLASNTKLTYMISFHGPQKLCCGLDLGPLALSLTPLLEGDFIQLALARGWPTSSIIYLIRKTNYALLRAFFFFIVQWHLFYWLHDLKKNQNDTVLHFIEQGHSCYLHQSSDGGSPLLSWPIAKMLDRQLKMEEAAGTSSAGPLGACLLPDNQN